MADDVAPIIADDFSLAIAARTVKMEARNQGETGMRAVAAVLVNRLKDGRWGKTLASVCLWPVQFSCWNTTDPNRRWMAEQPDTEFADAYDYVGDALNPMTPDPTNGSTHYYNPHAVPPPPWIKAGRLEGKIGDQLFYSRVA